MSKLIIIALLQLIIAPGITYPLQRYILLCDRTLLSASRDSLLAQVGVREKSGRNDGEKIRDYLKSVGLTEGSPYCAAGQYWCFYTSATDLGLSLESIPIERTGSTFKMFNAGKQKGHKTKPLPRTEDLLFWRRPNDWRGHVERIIEVRSAGWVVTVGFNTSSGERGLQNEGDGVYKRLRNIYHPIGRLVVRGLIGFKST